jgi:hypothetical protein
MIQAGRLIGNIQVCQGNVVYLAGENPEDLKARLHGMCLTYRLKEPLNKGGLDCI